MSRTGWAWGTTDSGKWLTIRGSHWTSPVLAETPEEAVRPAGTEWPDQPFVLAKVTEVFHSGVASGRAYRIIEKG